MRTPHEIAAEAKTVVETAASQFVPVPPGVIEKLSVEFMVSMTEGFADAVAEAVAAQSPASA